MNEFEGLLRLMILGYPKVGKTVAASTAPKPILFINSDQDDALEPLSREGLKPDVDFYVKKAHKRAEMESALLFGKKLLSENKIQTIVHDTITGFSDDLADECLDADKDGRTAWHEYFKYLRNLVNRLRGFKCHVIINSHHETQTEEWRPGKAAVVPSLYGKSAEKIPALMTDIVFLDKVGENRVFLTDIDGVCGPGGRSSKNIKQIPAKIEEFIKMKNSGKVV